MRQFFYLTLISLLFSVSAIAADDGARFSVTRVAGSRQKARVADARSSWHEGFEACDESRLDWLPEGWTAERTPEFLDAKAPHTWIAQKQLNYFYPTPVEGKYYMCAYYNDNEVQDEWLYTPELKVGEGEWFTYFVTLQPFFLFDMKYFDESTVSYSEMKRTADLETYVSVDGGSWQKVSSLYETYLEENDVNGMYQLAHLGYATNRKMFVDMTAYAGHSVRVAFRYYGKGGDSMYLDDLSLTTLSMQTGYATPLSAMYLGMTKDFKQPATCLFIPDKAPVQWENTSSLEARHFEWTYPSVDNLTVMSTSGSDANLITVYQTYADGSETRSTDANIATVPTLQAKGIAGLEGSYSHPARQMKIGGKAQVSVDGTMYATGASYCNPADGITTLLSSQGAPYFGSGKGNAELWSTLFNTEGLAKCTGFGSHINEPARPYTLRGVWVQGIGNIEKAYRLSLKVLKRDMYGGLDTTPLAVAYIDSDNILCSEPDAEGHCMYTLPFLFPDPVTVGSEVWIVVEGIDKAASFFAPLQTDKTVEHDDDSHAIFQIYYEEPGFANTGIYYVSDLSLPDAEGTLHPCRNNFFVNLDLAYGDCDDWTHIDIGPTEPEMPVFNVTPNTVQLYDIDADQPYLFADERTEKPLRCAFYDESNPEHLTLYACIGALYDVEGGPFYSDDLHDTYHVKITLPYDALGKTATIDGDAVQLSYYDIMTRSVLLHATSGSITVSRGDNHVYYVDFNALDRSTLLAIAGNVSYTNQWRWRDFNEARPDPSIYQLKKSGEVTEFHEIRSCVLDNTVPGIPTFYFADVPGLTSVAEVLALSERDGRYVVVTVPEEYIDGKVKGFSGVRDDRLNVRLKGIDYNSTTCSTQAVASGGNVQVTRYDQTNSLLTLSSTLFGVVSENTSTFNLHYNGTFAVEGADAIHNVSTNATPLHPLYDLQGRAVTHPQPRHIYISNGQKVIFK